MMSRLSEWGAKRAWCSALRLDSFSGLSAKVSAGVVSAEASSAFGTGTEARTALRASQQRALQPPGVSRCAPHAAR